MGNNIYKTNFYKRKIVSDKHKLMNNIRLITLAIHIRFPKG